MELNKYGQLCSTPEEEKWWREKFAEGEKKRKIILEQEQIFNFYKDNSAYF